MTIKKFLFLSVFSYILLTHNIECIKKEKKGLINMLVNYNELLDEFRHYLKDDVWEKSDIVDYVEYLKNEYDLDDIICRHLQSDFETIFDNEYVEID